MNLLSQDREGLSDTFVVADKLPVEVIESEEGLDSLYVRGFLLVYYRFNFLRIDADTVYSDDKTEEPGRYRIKLALLNIRLKACFRQLV